MTDIGKKFSIGRDIVRKVVSAGLAGEKKPMKKTATVTKVPAKKAVTKNVPAKKAVTKKVPAKKIVKKVIKKK